MHTAFYAVGAALSNTVNRLVETEVTRLLGHVARKCEIHNDRG